MRPLSPEEIAACLAAGLLPERLPSHIAIVMDGNGRWAKQRFMPRIVGHKNGAESLRATIKTCAALGIQVLSVYAFSTENWKRPEEEVSFLMGFIKEMLAKETAALHTENIKIRVLGDLQALDSSIQAQIEKSETLTQQNDRMQFNILINYGSRREIVHTMNVLAKTNTPITEDSVSEHLYTGGLPDPDVLIRTGGDHRISNFLLWQCAYSELFFLDTLWPDFDKHALIDVIKKYQSRERRFGGLK